MRNTISLLFFLTTSIWACSNPQSDGHGSMENMRHDVLGIEILTPLMQDKNNLQIKTDYQVIVGYQKSF